MLTFRRSVILLVSIISILAIIAVGTGLSPLYWPMPRNSTNDSPVKLITKIVNSSSLKTQMTTRLKPVPKKYDHLTTVRLITASLKLTNIIPVNATFISP